MAAMLHAALLWTVQALPTAHWGIGASAASRPLLRVGGLRPGAQPPTLLRSAAPRPFLRVGGLHVQPPALLRPAWRRDRAGGPARMVHPVKVPFSAQDYLKSTGRHTLADDWIASGLPRWVTLIDEALFVVAAAIFVRGSFDFYPSATYSVYLEGCELFILGSLMQLGLAFFTTYEICEDARRSGREPERSLLFEQALYVAGSVFFTVGTILFTPPIGFLSSLGGIRTPSQPVSPEPTAAADAAAAAASMAGGGAVADIVSGGGGVVDTVAELADTVVSAAENLKIGFFGTSVELQGGEPIWAPDNSLLTGDVLFVVGSVLFAVAAFVSALKAAGESGGDASDALGRRTAVATASLYELGSVAYCIGTLGYIPAGSLGIADCPAGVHTLGNAGATLFVIGSMLYTLGALITFIAVGYITYQQPYTDGGATVSWIGGEEDTTPHTPATSAGGGDERVRSGGAAKQEGVWHVGGQGRLGQILLEEVDAQPADEAFSARGWLDGAVVRGMGGFVGSRRNSEEATRATELMPEQGAADATAPRADLVAISEYLAESNVSDILACMSPLQRRELAARLQAAPDDVVRIRTETDNGLELSHPVLLDETGSARTEASLAADALVKQEALLVAQLQRAKESLASAAGREAQLGVDASRVMAQCTEAKAELARARLGLQTAEARLEDVRGELEDERRRAGDAREWFA